MRITIHNNAPLSVGYIPNMVSKDNISATFIVKAAYRLNAEYISDDYSEDASLLSGTLPFVSGEPGAYYDTDFAPFKPRADILVTGSAKKPSFVENNEYTIGVRVGSLSKKLCVVGPRYWKSTIDGQVVASAAASPSNVNLNYCNSFGSSSYQKNPHGTGYLSSGEILTSENSALPQLEQDKTRVKQPTDTIDAAGYGPLDINNPIRSNLLGTYDDKWLKDSWPWFPEDIDWGFFNSAPKDQQVDGYLDGTESIELLNLIEGSPNFQTEMPQHKLSIALTECAAQSHENGQSNAQKVSMKLDTLWIDVDERKLVLVWRGIARVKTPKLKEIEDVFVVREDIGEKEKSTAELLKLLQQQQQINDSDDIVFETNMLSMEGDNWIEEPGNIPENASLQIDTENGELHLAEVENDDLALEYDKHKKYAKSQDVIKLMDAKFNGPTELSVEQNTINENDEYAKKEIIRINEEAEKEVALLEAENENKYSGEQESIALEAFSLQAIQTKCCEGLQLKDQQLTGIYFKDTDFTGCEFFDCRFSNVSFVRCKLSNVVFKQCIFDNTELIEVDFNDGALIQSTLRNVQFQDTDISDAEISETNLGSTAFSNCSATYADFNALNFTGVNIEQCKFVNCGFEQCTIDNVNFDLCDLSECNFIEVNGIKSSFVGAILYGIKVDDASDFSNCNFTNSNLSESQWDATNLALAIFDYSLVDNARFEGCCLQEIKMNSANAKNVCFDYANLIDAFFFDTNLLKSSFEFANLRGASIQYSNLYGSNMLFSEQTGLHLESSFLENAIIGDNSGR